MNIADLKEMAYFEKLPTVYAKFQEYARKQGASEEEISKIPYMLRASALQVICENYTGPTPEEICPEYFGLPRIVEPGEIILTRVCKAFYNEVPENVAPEEMDKLVQQGKVIIEEMAKKVQAMRDKEIRVFLERKGIIVFQLWFLLAQFMLIARSMLEWPG